MLKVYEYAGCSTCRRALKFLDARGVKFERIPIVERPPNVSELRRMLKHLAARGGDFKRLFNTSGERYRALKIPDRLRAGLDPEAAFALLSREGKLIKRPFLLSATDGTVGFDEATWAEVIDSRR